MDHKLQFYSYAAAAAFNLCVFSAIAPVFIKTYHHHWVVPFFCGVLLAEVLFLYRCAGPWKTYALDAVLAWIFLTGAVLFWRQFSMFECYRRCAGRLSLGVFLLTAAAGLYLRSAGSSRRKAVSRLTLFLFAAWLCAVLAAGLRKGGLNLN
jgi:hypothetical protein